LGMAQFVYHVAQYSTFSCIEEEGSNFSLGGGRHHVTQLLGLVEDWSVRPGWLVAGFVTKKVMAPSAAACFGLGEEIGRVIMDVKYHIACLHGIEA
jgi:hypothetical protein